MLPKLLKTINKEKKLLEYKREHTERSMQECVLSSNKATLNVFQFTIAMCYFYE